MKHTLTKYIHSLTFSQHIMLAALLSVFPSIFIGGVMFSGVGAIYLTYQLIRLEVPNYRNIILIHGSISSMIAGYISLLGFFIAYHTHIQHEWLGYLGIDNVPLSASFRFSLFLISLICAGISYFLGYILIQKTGIAKPPVEAEILFGNMSLQQLGDIIADEDDSEVLI